MTTDLEPTIDMHRVYCNPEDPDAFESTGRGHASQRKARFLHLAMMILSSLAFLFLCIAFQNNIACGSPPFVENPVEDYSIEEDSIDNSVNLDMVFSDDDGDDLFFNFTGGSHVTCNISLLGEVTIIPEENWTGTTLLEFSASDASSTEYHSFNLEIIPVDDAPLPIIVSPEPGEEIPMGKVFQFDGDDSEDVDSDIEYWRWYTNTGQVLYEGPEKKPIYADNLSLDTNAIMLNISSLGKHSETSVPVTMVAPDLIFTGEIAIPANLSVDSNVILRITIMNSGSYSASDVRISLKVNGAASHASTFSSIRSDESVDVSFSWKVTDDDNYTFDVRIDPDNSIIELDEGNNVWGRDYGRDELSFESAPDETDTDEMQAWLGVLLVGCLIILIIGAFMYVNVFTDRKQRMKFRWSEAERELEKERSRKWSDAAKKSKEESTSGEDGSSVLPSDIPAPTSYLPSAAPTPGTDSLPGSMQNISAPEEISVPIPVVNDATETKFCLRCGIMKPEEMAICDTCGSILKDTKLCKHCGHRFPKDFKFCNMCGKSVDDPQN